MATILVVDDLSANRRFLVAILSHHGHHLIEAANGHEGLAAVHAAHVDLVITDVLMPVMDGYEFVRQLRLDPSTQGIPVIFYTAHYGEREARALALSNGVAYVLPKPAEAEEVWAIVNRVLSGEAATGLPPSESASSATFNREHLRLLTDQLSASIGDVRTANARLRALINIGLELASERDPDRLLQSVCTAAHDLFGATYVTLGILDLSNRTVQRFVTFGAEGDEWIRPGDAISGILERVVTERRTVRGDNPGGDPAALQLPARHPEVQTFLAAPVASPTNVYGWICLVGNESRVFTDEDEQLVTALSGQVGRIYENGYFSALAEKRANELEREILERKEVEAALRHEGDRAQRYLDTAQVILLALDLDCRITLINRYACFMLGWTAAELIGRDWIEMCLPERIRPKTRERFQNLLNGDLSVVENPILSKSGEERVIEWCNTLLRDDAGCIVGTFSSGTNITIRSQAIEALQATEERTRFALEGANVGIWDMDYVTGEVKWSDTLAKHYGVKPGAFKGTFDAFIELIHPDDRASVLATVGKAMKAGSDFTVLNRTILPDGRVRWLSGAGRVHLDANGQPLRAVGISWDVTEHRMLEVQSQQAQKMEAIGRLAGGVAHDFNNLLTVILGYCELLLGDISPNDPRQDDIVQIQKAGSSAAALTRRLLAFSRKQILEPKLLDLNVVVTDVRRMLERLIGEDVRIVLSLLPTLARVKADRAQMEQIILNLSVNARDAMPTGGTLTIQTENVELDENYTNTHFSVEPGAYVALAVTDTGTGITPEVQLRLFEPFFTTKDLSQGTGLGLSTVHGIVTQSGGSVHVYSELGKGTTFKVYLPQAATGQIIVDVPVARLSQGTATVLVVDDAASLRELAKRLLEREGYTVLLAANADEAVRLFNQHPSIEVLLTDVVMPGESGPELTKKLVQERPTLKVIYMSGYTEEAIVRHGVINAGITFLNKPFTAEMLGRKVREVVDA